MPTPRPSPVARRVLPVVLGLLLALLTPVPAGAEVYREGVTLTASPGPWIEGAPIEVTAAYDGRGAEPVRYVFNWDDGSEFGDAVSASAAAPFEAALSHAYADDGTFSVVVRVFDAVGDVYRADLDLSVANAAPSVGTLPDVLAPLGEVFELEVPFGDSGIGDGHELRVDWGDGTVDDFAPVGQPATAVHTYAALGPVTATVTIRDDDGGEGSATFTVDVVATCLGRPVTIDVAALGVAPGEEVRGTTGDDVILGTDGADLIKAKGGDDVVCGGGGDDTILGGGGADVVDAGDGDDTVRSGPGDDEITGGPGADRLVGAGGDDVIDAGEGNDTVFALHGVDTVEGGPGDDRLLGGPGDDTVYGGVGTDEIDGQGGRDHLLGGEGNDTITGGPGGDLLEGEAGDDKIQGGGGDDTAFGGEGADIVRGANGKDVLSGGPGDDLVDGGVNDDEVAGDEGRDRVYGREGRDLLRGGEGLDFLYGGEGPDTLRGDDGNDRIFGQGGDDALGGGSGADRLEGGEGSDVLHGGPGGDILLGNAGSDFLFHSEAPNLDTLFGGIGEDVVGVGKRGTDATGLRRWVTEEQALAFQGASLLSNFATPHDPAANRVINIQRMADTVDGYLVMPGEVFSINTVVGRRTEAKGYVRAGAIIAGSVRCCDDPANVGGGTSQFGTTFYNAIFFSGLQEVDHTPHTLYFSRYPAGREATMGYPGLDVAFRNDSEKPVLITTHHADWRTATEIRVKFWGDTGGRQATARHSCRPPYSLYRYPEVDAPATPCATFSTDKRVWEADDSMDPDDERVVQGLPGFAITVWRDIRSPDGSVKTSSFRWTYSAQPNVVYTHSCNIPPVDDYGFQDFDYTGEPCPGEGGGGGDPIPSPDPL